MNVNITGIYDNTVIVDNNLFEDVRLLQTRLSSLSGSLFKIQKIIQAVFKRKRNAAPTQVFNSHPWKGKA